MTWKQVSLSVCSEEGKRPLWAEGLETMTRLKGHLISLSCYGASGFTEFKQFAQSGSKTGFGGESGNWPIDVLCTTDVLRVLLEWQLVGTGGWTK